MMMNRFFAYVAIMLLTMTMTSPASAMTNDDDYEAQTVATSWYADRCQSIITRFEGLRNNAGQLPQKYCVMPSSEAGAVKYALVVSTWDESMKVMYTPQGNDVKAKVFSGVVPEDIYWESLPRLLSYATHSRDITLSKRPLPVRYVDKEHNSFSAVTDYSEKLSNIRRYNQMMFKPHVNEVRFVKQNRKVNNPISDEALELIGERGTGPVFVGFADKMTQAPLKNWLKAAGITKKISFHCSRHTFGSLQVDAGTSVYTVQQMLGHKNVSTTQIYANMADESKRESVNRITLKPMKTVQLKIVGQ